MKKTILKFVYLYFISLTIISCNEEESINQSNYSLNVTSMVRKNYDVATNSVLNTINYSVGNNKIQTVMVLSQQNNVQSLSDYNYLSNKLTEIINSINGIHTSSSFFIYDSNHHLIEYRTEGYNANGETQTINKHQFTRIQDTIFSEWTRKTTSSSEFTPIQSSKIVLDQNNNRTYFESYDHLNNIFKKIISTFDTNNNILSENHFQLQNGTYSNVLSNNYTYDNSFSTLQHVMNETYGREVLMLLYHLQTNAINEINVKSYSPNNLISYNSTFDNQTTFTFSTILNNNYSTKK